MHAVSIPRYTLQEYLTAEQGSETRHEFINGELFAMVGASRAHNLLATRLAARLVHHLEDTPCRVFQSDMKLRIDTADCFYYPDIMVCCEPVENEPDEYYETQAKLVIEILSPSTALRDSSEKRLNYQTLPSLQEYILLPQDKPSGRVYRRTEAGWICVEFGADDILQLRSIDFNLALQHLYQV